MSSNQSEVMKIIREFINKLRQDFPDNINFIIIENIITILEKFTTIAWIECIRNIIAPYHSRIKLRDYAFFQSKEFKEEIHALLKNIIETIFGVWIAQLIPIEILLSDDFFNGNVQTYNAMSPAQQTFLWLYIDLLFTAILDAKDVSNSKGGNDSEFIKPALRQEE